MFNADTKIKTQNIPPLQTGFGLVELMVAMALGLVLIGGVIQVFTGNVQIFHANNGAGRVQESARFVIAELSSQLRSVGFTGCMSKDSSVTNQAASIYDLDSASADIYTYQVPADGIISVGATDITGAKVGTDAITIKTLVDEAKLTANTTTTTLTVNDASLYAANDVLFIGDCESNDIVDIASVSGNTITLTDSLTAPYETDAVVYRMEVTTYYVAPTSQLNLTANSLFKQVNEGAGEELAVGVENMQFLFGVDSGSDNVPDQFFEAGSASVDARKVMVVRVLLNTTSIKPIGSDGIMSRDFTVSISLRNRLTAGAG